MSNLILRSAARTSLSSLQSGSSALNTITKLTISLSTDTKSTRTLSDPLGFSSALGASSQVGNLYMLKKIIDQGINTIRQNTAKTTDISKSLQQLKSDTTSAADDVDDYKEGHISKEELAERLTKYQTSYKNSTSDINASTAGQSLLTGGKLSISMSEGGGGTFSVQGSDFTSEGLGLQTKAGKDSSVAEISTQLVDQDLSELAAALTGPDDTATLDKISNVLNARSATIDAAANKTDNLASTFSSSISQLQSYQGCVQGYIGSLNMMASKITVADLDGEGASSLALQTRSQLSITTLSCASNTEQSVLRLFG